MLGVGRDRDQRLGRDLEQEIVDDRLVLVGDVGDGRRQREDDVEVGHRQQLGRALCQPFSCCRALALRTVAAFRGTPDALGSAKIGDWYAMVTGRLGYAFDRVLVYAKGGAAFIPVRAAVVDTCATVPAGCGNWLISTFVDDTITTWTIGGGIEWAFADNWSIKGEYMFIGLDETLTSCGPATLANGNVVSGGSFCFGHDFSGIHTAKVGLNYRFGQLWR